VDDVASSQDSETMSSSELGPGRRTHIMLSYCWAKKSKPALVRELGEALRRSGYDVWRDEVGVVFVVCVVMRSACNMWAGLQGYFTMLCRGIERVW